MTKTIPTLKTGYAYEFRGRNWRAVSSERWEVMAGFVADNEGRIPGVFVGTREIDGAKCNVFKAGPRLFYAQLEHYGY